MVERFNGRIADVLKTHRFNSREDMEQTLLRYVALYNHQLPQSALKSKYADAGDERVVSDTPASVSQATI
jgi:transposase InsO family protein